MRLLKKPASYTHLPLESDTFGSSGVARPTAKTQRTEEALSSSKLGVDADPALHDAPAPGLAVGGKEVGGTGILDERVAPASALLVAYEAEERDLPKCAHFFLEGVLGALTRLMMQPVQRRRGC